MLKCSHGAELNLFTIHTAVEKTVERSEKMNLEMTEGLFTLTVDLDELRAIETALKKSDDTYSNELGYELSSQETTLFIF